MSPSRPPGGRRAALLAAAEHVAAAHPGMAAVVAVAGPPDLRQPQRDRFRALARSIVFQQLAGRVANVIYDRFVLAIGGVVTPTAVLLAGEDALRSAGLSGAKTAALLDLAARVDAGDVRLDRIGRHTDEEIVTELSRVRGIGRWTAQMFLIFELGRLDVWPTGDLGVRAGLGRILGLETPPDPKAMEPLGDPFRPYRSVAAWYCWRAVDTVVPG